MIFIRNISFSIFTQLDTFWESNISYSNNFYNAGKKYNELSLFLEQDVSSINFNIIYHGDALLNRLNSGVSFTYGSGDQEFTYLGFATTLNQSVLGNIQIDWNLQIHDIVAVMSKIFLVCDHYK